jgi:hypothetical protein
MHTMEFETRRERHAELLREAEEERLARRLQEGGRRRVAHGLLKRAGDLAGLVFASRRPAGEVTAGVEVRWATPEDEEKISELLELNGAPRAMAAGEGFIVAEKDGDALPDRIQAPLAGDARRRPLDRGAAPGRGAVLRRSRAGPGNGRQEVKVSLRQARWLPGRVSPGDDADRLEL